MSRQTFREVRFALYTSKTEKEFLRKIEHIKVKNSLFIPIKESKEENIIEMHEMMHSIIKKRFGVSCQVYLCHYCKELTWSNREFIWETLDCEGFYTFYVLQIAPIVICIKENKVKVINLNYKFIYPQKINKILNCLL